MWIAVVRIDEGLGRGVLYADRAWCGLGGFCEGEGIAYDKQR